MNTRSTVGQASVGWAATTCLVWLLAAGAPVVAAPQAEDGELDFYADFRLRAEADWDSRRADGTSRDDRNRIRIRARFGLNWKPLDGLTFGLRLRSGADDSQQSPHITIVDLDDNDTGAAEINFDKWFVKARRGKLSGWAGRNSLPLWKQNELLWDDDVTPAGLAGTLVQPVGEQGKLTFHLGYFSAPVGMQHFSGNVGLGQAVYGRNCERGGFTVAAGLLDIEANLTDAEAGLLRNGNGERDYSIVTIGGQGRIRAGGRPLTFGVDVFDNGETYSDEIGDPFGFANRDETDGHVVSIQWGSTGNRGDWLIGYWYASIGALALNASYAQDDQVRWGSATETDSSDLEGHELRFAYGLGAAGNVVARLYLVDNAGGGSATIPARGSQQDGKRFRLDYNLKF